MYLLHKYGIKVKPYCRNKKLLFFTSSIIESLSVKHTPNTGTVSFHMSVIKYSTHGTSLLVSNVCWCRCQNMSTSISNYRYIMLHIQSICNFLKCNFSILMGKFKRD